jgi:hypothetical protein
LAFDDLRRRLMEPYLGGSAKRERTEETTDGEHEAKKARME